MIELYLSSDGKHTVHASAETPEELAVLAPKAKALYEKVLEYYGTKAQMWQTPLPGNGNGQATIGKTIGALTEAADATAPHCPVHDRPMKLRKGKFGDFWSCSVRLPNGRWCKVTKEVNTSDDCEYQAD